MQKTDFQKITDWLWEIPKGFRQDMRVPARAYVREKIESFKTDDPRISQKVL